MLEMLKVIEKLRGKVEEYKRKYSESYAAFENAAKALDEKIKDLKAKSATKCNDLQGRIKNTEECLADKIQASLNGSISEAEMRDLSIELDLLKRQFTSLTEDERKTLVINCRKEIDRVKSSFQEAANQYHILYEVYKKYYAAIEQLEVELKKIKNDEDKSASSYLSIFHDMASTSMPGIDALMSRAEYLFNTRIKAPGSSIESPDPLAYDLVSNYYLWTAHPAAQKEAKRVIEKL